MRLAHHIDSWYPLAECAVRLHGLSVSYIYLFFLEIFRFLFHSFFVLILRDRLIHRLLSVMSIASLQVRVVRYGDQL